jgi:hypothetical protein
MVLAATRRTRRSRRQIYPSPDSLPCNAGEGWGGNFSNDLAARCFLKERLSQRRSGAAVEEAVLAGCLVSAPSRLCKIIQSPFCLGELRAFARDSFLWSKPRTCAASRGRWLRRIGGRPANGVWGSGLLDLSLHPGSRETRSSRGPW